MIDISQITKKKISIKANAKDTLYRYVNPKSTKEYFVIQALNYSKWYPTHNVAGHSVDTGLAIWHVVEDESDPMSPWFRLVQADGVDLMNDRSTKPPVATGNDDRVLFGKTIKLVNGKINPMFRWRDGKVPNLEIRDISLPSNNMTFNISLQ